MQKAGTLIPLWHHTGMIVSHCENNTADENGREIFQKKKVVLSLGYRQPHSDWHNHCLLRFSELSSLPLSQIHPLNCVAHYVDHVRAVNKWWDYDGFMPDWHIWNHVFTCSTRKEISFGFTCPWLLCIHFYFLPSSVGNLGLKFLCTCVFSYSL